jgi:hypothetical protein
VLDSREGLAMSGDFEAKVTGLPDLREALAGIVPKLRVRALRNALTAGARLVQRAARAATPVLKLSTRSGQAAYRKGYRKPGTVKQAISVRQSKVARRQGNVGVFVNVRPAKGGARGAKSYRDPFYWRWLNWGWNPRGQGGGSSARLAHRKRAGAKSKPGAEFLESGARMLSAALAEFTKRIGPAIEKLNRPKAPAP